MNKKTIDKLKSFVRHFLITAAAVFTVNPDADWKAVIAGAVAGVVGPAIRAIDKNDPAFGRVGDWAEEKIKKAAVRAKKQG